MPGLDPGIHALEATLASTEKEKTWMPATSAGMTNERESNEFYRRDLIAFAMSSGVASGPKFAR